jgi:hypothetical protein
LDRVDVITANAETFLQPIQILAELGLFGQGILELGGQSAAGIVGGFNLGQCLSEPCGVTPLGGALFKFGFLTLALCLFPKPPLLRVTA